MDMYPVGTGPFVFKKYVKDNVLRLEKNSNYFLGPERIDQLIFSITPYANVRLQKLKAGECHFIAEPAPAEVASMKTIKSIKISQRPGLNVGYMAFNTQKKPFDNVLVRQALNMALNREAYLEAIYLGNAVKAKNPIPPSMWAYNDKAKSYSYDPKKARELLKKAGYENGFTADLWTMPVSRP